MTATFRDYDRRKTGAKIKSLLTAATGVTAMELAEELDLSDTTVKNIINGRKGMSANTLFHIAQYFGVSVDYLIDPETADTFGKTADHEEYTQNADHGSPGTRESSVSGADAQWEQTSIFSDGRRGYVETERGGLIKEIALCADQLDMDSLRRLKDITENIRDIYLRR